MSEPFTNLNEIKDDIEQITVECMISSRVRNALKLICERLFATLQTYELMDRGESEKIFQAEKDKAKLTEKILVVKEGLEKLCVENHEPITRRDIEDILKELQ